MDAIQLLERDHQHIKSVMTAIDKAIGVQKKDLFLALVRELKVHDRVEENLFYPAVRDQLETAGDSAADKDAHLSVGKALARLSALSIEDPEWTLGFDAMRIRLLAHESDEEKHLFVKIRGLLSAAQLDELGLRMKAEKERLQAPA